LRNTALCCRIFDLSYIAGYKIDTLGYTYFDISVYGLILLTETRFKSKFDFFVPVETKIKIKEEVEDEPGGEDGQGNGNFLKQFSKCDKCRRSRTKVLVPNSILSVTFSKNDGITCDFCGNRFVYK
jgi:hypothetical protein